MGTNIGHVYSYTAVFEDGTVIEQDRNDVNGDVSLTRNDGTGSRFTDVQEKEKESKLISFVLHNDEESIGVDLRDGHFEFNGRAFFQHRPNLPDEAYKDFRVIYFRTVVVEINQATGETTNGEVAAYGLGWQTTIKNADDEDENVKRILYF